MKKTDDVIKICEFGDFFTDNIHNMSNKFLQRSNNHLICFKNLFSLYFFIFYSRNEKT